jgi:hypothetical protein
MVYRKNSLESRLLSNTTSDLSPNKRILLNEIFELNSSCKENHEAFFIDNLEKFVYSLEDSLNSEEKYKIEEITENLEFIYNLKELKDNYKFGNLPEKGEEENIIELYKVIANNCEKLSYKQLSKAASLVHYLSNSDKWEKVNYISFLSYY